MEWIYETNNDNSARFALGQIYDSDKKTLFCFGINPSTACPEHLDKTINKIISISKNNTYENWIMLNVYPQRATNPDDMHSESEDDLIAQNMLHIKTLMAKYPNSDVLLAYGNLISKRPYLKRCLKDIIHELNSKGKRLVVIKLTNSGNPIHPLYQPSTSTLRDYNV